METMEASCEELEKAFRNWNFDLSLQMILFV